MPKKQRRYDTLTEEDFDKLGYYATLAYELLVIRFGWWKQHFGQSQRTKDDAYTVAWANYVKNMEGTGIPTEKLGGFKKPKNLESFVRGEMLKAVFNEILSPHLQGEERYNACNNISSIMSVRTWEERKRKEAMKNSLPLIRLPHRPPPTLSEKRARWQESMLVGPVVQSGIGLHGDRVGVTETPITTLPPQTTELVRHEASREVNLCMPDIVADADRQQQLHNEVYPRPKWFKNRRRHRYQARD